jgi:hypothetical protein
MTADLTLYLDDGAVLIRPENATARKHLEENAPEYQKWLVRFYFADGSRILFGPKPGGAIFVKPGSDLRTLADTLVNRGFTVVKDDKLIKLAEPPADADFLVYYEGSKILVRPQHSTARSYLEANLPRDGQGWLNGALVIKDTSVVPFVHKLKVAGFNVVGQSALVRSALRLYVHEGKWWLYTGGRAIPPKLVGQIIKTAGRPN